MQMKWSKLLSPVRLGRAGTVNRDHADIAGRSPYTADVDRITFSASFRRLAGKTQVFPLSSNDHIHTRLTHSLEVSRVGRTLGTSVGRGLLANRKVVASSKFPVTEADFGAVVEAASLAHDIGHPPFGHAGDRAIRLWCDSSPVAKTLWACISPGEATDLRKFDGNAQGFRRLTQLEKNIFAGGLNLTYATLGAYIKYPKWASLGASKTGFFISETHIIESVADVVGMAPQSGGYTRHPLSYLVEAADDICYGFLDLEDAVEMGILSLHDVADSLLRVLPKSQRKKFRPSKGSRSHRVVFARMRGKVFAEAIATVGKEFIRNYEAIMEGEFPDDLLGSAARRGNVSATVVLDAKKRAKEEIFSYSHKANIELGSCWLISKLLDEFVSAAVDFAAAYAQNPKNPKVDFKQDELLRMLGDHGPKRGNAPPGQDWTAYQCARRAIDFVSGMTDAFAVSTCQLLSGHIELRK
jgi:dGTPase